MTGRSGAITRTGERRRHRSGDGEARGRRWRRKAGDSAGRGNGCSEDRRGSEERSGDGEGEVR